MGMAQRIQLRGRSIAQVDNLPHEMQVLARKRMVEVNGNLVLTNLQNLCIHHLSVHGVHRHDSAYIHALAIELAIAVEEHLLVQIQHTFLIVLAVGIGMVDAEVELAVFCLPASASSNFGSIMPKPWQ